LADPIVTKLCYTIDCDPDKSEIWAPPPKIRRPKEIKMSARFRATLQLDREYRITLHYGTYYIT